MIPFARILLVMWLLAVPLSTGAAEIVLGLALAAALAARFVEPQPGNWPLGWRSLVTGGPTTRSVPWLWLAFLAWYLVTVIASVDPAMSAAKLPKLFRYCLFFLPLAVPWRESQWRLAFWIQIPLLLILTGLGIESLLAGHSRAETYNLHYNTLAQVAAMISLLLLAAFFYGPPAAKRERWLLLAGSCLGAALMVITLSRAAYLAWWLAAAMLVLFRLPRRVALTAVMIIVLVPAIAVPLLRTSRSDVIDLQDPEFTRRYDMWRMGVAIVQDRPLTGLGPGGLDIKYDEYKTGVLVDDPQYWSTLHNDVFTVMMIHGIPAAAIWVALVLILYVSYVRRLVHSRHRSGSWLMAGYIGTGACLQMFYLFGLVHDNYAIYLKTCTLLLLWGLFVAADRELGPLVSSTNQDRDESQPGPAPD